MVFNRLKSTKGGRERGFDVRGVSLHIPERQAEKDEFPEELVISCRDKMEKTLESLKHDAAFNYFLEILLTLQSLFPERLSAYKEIVEKYWKKNQVKIAREQIISPQDASAYSLLQNFYLCAQGKARVLANYMGLDVTLIALASSNKISEVTLGQEALFLKNKQTLETSPEQYQALIQSLEAADNWYRYAHILLYGTLGRPELLRQILKKDAQKIRNFRQTAAAEIYQNMEICRQMEIDKDALRIARAYGNLAKTIFMFKLLYSEGLEITPQGTRFIKPMEDKSEPSFSAAVPQPLAKDF